MWMSTIIEHLLYNTQCSKCYLSINNLTYKTILYAKYYYFYFTDEEAEIYRGQVVLPQMKQ